MLIRVPRYSLSAVSQPSCLLYLPNSIHHSFPHLSSDLASSKVRHYQLLIHPSSIMTKKKKKSDKNRKKTSTATPATSQLAQANAQESSPFFQRLPQELRDLIYSHIFRSTRLSHGERKTGYIRSIYISGLYPTRCLCCGLVVELRLRLVIPGLAKSYSTLRMVTPC